MATITKIARLGVRPVLAYTKVDASCGCPGGVFAGHSVCKCDGCTGKKGDCIHAVASDKLVVSFLLDDGRGGTVNVATGATDTVIKAAIQTWATANLKVSDPLIGQTVV